MLSNKPSLNDQLQADLIATKPGQTFACQSLGDSQIGRVRSTNEDALLELAAQQLWAVADGMGGLSRGDYASKLVAEGLRQYQKAATLPESLDRLQAIFDQANDACQTAFRGKKIGTTVALLHLYGDLGLIIWAGDSRVYRLRHGQLTQLSSDHSVAEQKRARGELCEATVDAHPTAHVLTRAVGVHRKLSLELYCQPVEAGDRYFLCTDGALLGVSFDDLCAALSQPDRNRALDSIVNQAMASGGRDNITGIVVDIEADVL